MNREAEQTIRALARHLGATREDLARIARTLPESSVSSLAEFATENEHRRSHAKEYASVAPLVYTPTQAAEALGVSRQHIYNMLARGELRSVRVGGRTRRVPLTELERLVSAARDRDETA